VVLKTKMSQFTNVADKEFQEPMADQVMMMEPELCLCVFVRCSQHLINIQTFLSYRLVYSCNCCTVENRF